jgi:two-component system response regulator DesR
VEGDSPLTERERDVLRAARDHATVADLSSAIHKLGAQTRAEAVRIAEEKGWL